MRMEAIAAIFDRCQRTSAAHAASVGALQRLLAADAPAFARTFCAHLNELLVVSGKGMRGIRAVLTPAEPSVTRVTAAVVAVLTQRPRASLCEGDVFDTFLTYVVRHLTEKLSVADKTVRARCAEILSAVVYSFGPETNLECVFLPAKQFSQCSERVEDKLVQQLLARLADKVPLVRAHAASALVPLQAPAEEPDDIVRLTLLALLAWDDNVATRTRLVRDMPLSTATVGCIVERVRDVSPLVRGAVLERLCTSGSFALLSQQMLQEVIDCALYDPDASVRSRAVSLILHFVDELGADPIELLRCLSENGNAGRAEAVARVLCAQRRLRPADFVQSRLSSSRRDGAFVLAWRVYTEHTHECAPWHEKERILDDLLPEVGFLCLSLEHHLLALDEETIDVASESPTSSTRVFILQELLRLSLFLDYSDEAGRRLLQGWLTNALSRSPLALIGPVVASLRSVTPSVSDFNRSALEALSEILEPLPGSNPVSPSTDALSARFRALHVACGVLEIQAGRALDPALTGLLDRLFLPAIQSSESVHRALAFRCLALYCQKSISFARRYVLLFLQALENDEEDVRVESLQALCNFLCVFGLAAFNDEESRALDDEAPRAGEAALVGPNMRLSLGEDSDTIAHVQPLPSDTVSLLRAVVTQSFRASVRLRVCATEALCKLYVHGVLRDTPILAKLLRDCHHPHTRAMPQLQKVLKAFFPYFATCGARSRVLLEKVSIELVLEVAQADRHTALGHVYLPGVIAPLVQHLRQSSLRRMADRLCRAINHSPLGRPGELLPAVLAIIPFENDIERDSIGRSKSTSAQELVDAQVEREGDVALHTLHIRVSRLARDVSSKASKMALKKVTKTLATLDGAPVTAEELQTVRFEDRLVKASVPEEACESEMWDHEAPSQSLTFNDELYDADNAPVMLENTVAESKARIFETLQKLERLSGAKDAQDSHIAEDMLAVVQQLKLTVEAAFAAERGDISVRVQTRTLMQNADTSETDRSNTKRKRTDAGTPRERRVQRPRPSADGTPYRPPTAPRKSSEQQNHAKTAVVRAATAGISTPRSESLWAKRRRERRSSIIEPELRDKANEEAYVSPSDLNALLSHESTPKPTKKRRASGELFGAETRGGLPIVRSAKRKEKSVLFASPQKASSDRIVRGALEQGRPSHASVVSPPAHVLFVGFATSTLQTVSLAAALNAVPNCTASARGDLTDAVTHVVVAAGTHSLASLAAALTGKWLMPLQWAQECARAGRLLPAHRYGVQGDARWLRHQLVYVESAFLDGALCWNLGEGDVDLLLRLGGAERVPERTRADLVLGGDGLDCAAFISSIHEALK